MEKKAMLSQPMGGRMSSKANCLNCGAPITGDVCEYCGTRYGGTVFVPVSSPPVICETLTICTIDGERYQIKRYGEL